MSPLTDNYARPSWGPQEDRRRVPVEEDEILYVGAIVESNAAGYGIAGDGTLGNIFEGIKIRQANGVDAGEWEVDNTGGDDGAVYAWVCREGVWQFAKSGTFTQADIGMKVKASDDNTVVKNLATVDTNLSNATQNDLSFTATKLFSGEIGNQISVKYVDPGGTSATEGVVVEGFTIIVNLGRAASAVNSTGTSVKAAIEAHALASKMVSVALKSGNDGSGLVAAMAAINLTGAGPTVGVVEELIGSELKVNIGGFAGRRAA